MLKYKTKVTSVFGRDLDFFQSSLTNESIGFHGKGERGRSRFNGGRGQRCVIGFSRGAHQDSIGGNGIGTFKHQILQLYSIGF